MQNSCLHYMQEIGLFYFPKITKKSPLRLKVHGNHFPDLGLYRSLPGNVLDECRLWCVQVDVVFSQNLEDGAKFQPPLLLGQAMSRTHGKLHHHLYTYSTHTNDTSFLDLISSGQIIAALVWHEHLPKGRHTCITMIKQSIVQCNYTYQCK